MRLLFEPEDSEIFEAATQTLMRRCESWAREQGAEADPPVIRAALEFRHQSIDGRLAYWTVSLVQDFLQHWMPMRVAATADDMAHAPEVLRVWLRYLHATQLADPTGESLRVLEKAISDSAVAFPTMMADERNFSPSKFWIMKAIERGKWSPVSRTRCSRPTSNSKRWPTSSPRRRASGC